MQASGAGGSLRNVDEADGEQERERESEKSR